MRNIKYEDSFWINSLQELKIYLPRLYEVQDITQTQKLLEVFFGDSYQGRTVPVIYK